MTLLVILIALVIDQARPLSSARVDGWIQAYGRFVESRVNAGGRRHGRAAWLAAVAAPALLLLLLQLALSALHFGWLVHLLGLGALYLTMGFRKFSHHFTGIQMALRLGEVNRARALLAEWRGGGAELLSSEEVARLAVEEALTASHGNVFAIFIWYVACGPAGALFYRLSGAISRQWSANGDPAFGAFAERAFHWIDWLPARLTAISFAIVGDFEDAVHCWRNQAASWPRPNDGVLLASGAGALGVRLGLPLSHGDERFRPELGLGADADVDGMQSVIGLLWRTLLMALLLLALLWLASLL